MKRIVGIVVVTLALLAPSAQARDAVVRSFDQTAISMHFFPAEGLVAGQRAPTVLVGPGWSMAGETDENSTSEELFGGVGVGALRGAGYNLLTWDPRGFGSSGAATGSSATARCPPRPCTSTLPTGPSR